MTGQLGVEPSSLEGLRKWAWEASDGGATKNLAAWRLERWVKDTLVQPISWEGFRRREKDTLWVAVGPNRTKSAKPQFRNPEWRHDWPAWSRT